MAAHGIRCRIRCRTRLWEWKCQERRWDDSNDPGLVWVYAAGDCDDWAAGDAVEYERT